MKVVGVVSVAMSPLYLDAIESLSKFCDEVYIRYDKYAGDPEHLRKLHKLQINGKLKLQPICVSHNKWTCPEWREDCLEIAAQGKPDIILCPDEDEMFDDSLADELKDFWKSDANAMMFSYHPLASDDGRTINEGMPYPPEPHCKAFKWKKGLSYFPYHGNAQIAQYALNPKDKWQAKTKINHYCAYTHGMEMTKRWRSDTPMGRGEKVVTMIGFGPSASQPMDIRGEIWSVNDCYNVFNPEMMKRTTRIFDIHMESKRERLVLKNGTMHFKHYDDLGKKGHRIILERPHPLVANSEAYPLYDVLHHFNGIRCYGGTIAYMMALAIMEGYTTIQIYGFDQMDWEHTIQRESFIFWCGIAMGKGIGMGGQLTFLSRYKRLYGYEYGPEMDDETNKQMWRGFPFEIKMKEESRAVRGDLFSNEPQ